MAPPTITRPHALVAALLAALAGCTSPQPIGEILPKDTSRPFMAHDLSGLVALVQLSCTIGANGLPSNCVVRSNQGNPAFIASALEYAPTILFIPPIKNGEPQATPDQPIPIGFMLATRFTPPDAPPTVQTFPTIVYPPSIQQAPEQTVRLSCTVGTDGSTSNCAMLSTGLDPAIAEQALGYVRAARYFPAWSAGHAVPAPDHRITFSFPTKGDFFPGARPAPKDIVFSKPSASTRLLYPSWEQQQENQGQVLVVCDLGIDGVNRNCAVGGVHGDPGFGPSALAYVSSEVIHATQNGQPVAIPGHRQIITFSLYSNKW